MVRALGCDTVFCNKKKEKRMEVRCFVLSVISRSTVSTASSSTRYEVRELVNPAAQCTLLIDSGSEPDSSVYESYAGVRGERGGGGGGERRGGGKRGGKGGYLVSCTTEERE